MRKTAAALIALGLAALTLAGCSAAPSFDGKACPTAPASADLAGSVSVKGDLGAEPTVHVSTPNVVQKLTVDPIITGKGTAVTGPGQPFVFDYVLYDGKTGARLGGSSFSGDVSQISTIASLEQSSKDLARSLQCATEGSRLLVGFPAGEVAPNPTVAVFDLVKVYLPHAEGSLRYNDALGLPTVVRAPDGRPGIIVPDAKEPSHLVVQTLIQGAGAKVTSSDGVVVQSTTVDWGTRKVVDTTWDGQVKGLSSADGEVFEKGVVGQTVGSQIMVVTPASQAGGSAQVQVVDILGIYTSSGK